MREGRKSSRRWARNVGPVPHEIDWRGKVLEDGCALLGESVSVGVLVAHHNNSIAVDAELLAQASVARLKVVDLAIELVHSVSVFIDHASVIFNLQIVPVNVLVVLAALLSCVVDSVLEAGDRLTEGFGSNKHVTGLGNLELVSVFTEESSISVESINSLMKIRSCWVGWGSSLIATVMRVLVVIVIVMLVEIGSVFTVLVSVLGFDGEGDSGKKKSCGSFHGLLFRLIL